MCMSDWLTHLSGISSVSLAINNIVFFYVFIFTEREQRRKLGVRVVEARQPAEEARERVTVAVVCIT